MVAFRPHRYFRVAAVWDTHALPGVYGCVWPHRYFRWPFTMAKLSVRKGEAGKPAPFHKFTTG